MSKLSSFRFDNTFLTLPSCLYTKLKLSPVASPNIITFNQELSDSLGLNLDASSPCTAGILSGNACLPEGGYFSQAYAGHQFGHLTILGDGRAMTLGEHLTPEHQRVDIQFKGSGPTPYSRQGDGRAGLGPMLREYLISESMHALGIPTTRSLAVVSTGETIRRQQDLPGAILTRVATSHLRVGSFQFAALQDDSKVLSDLLDYTIQRHYPDRDLSLNPAITLLTAVMEQQIACVVEWMRVGFIHGVMNTDNVTISGETIDYGPCAFMDSYDPETVLSSIDTQGRYAFDQQPIVMQWNIAVFAQALLPLIDTCQDTAIAMAQAVIDQYPSIYQERWLNMMRKKIGVFNAHDDDGLLIDDLLQWMHKHQADFTNTFRYLCRPEVSSDPLLSSPSFKQWHQRWIARQVKDSRPIDDAIVLMDSVNPFVIPRNHYVERVLQAAYDQDMTPFYELESALKQPYQQASAISQWTVPPTDSERVRYTFCGT
ncbi:MAG: hypothetical protein CMF55_05575 [Legionellales bacterium]|nr:hypothetical protein [Legionellales bacterium]